MRYLISILLVVSYSNSCNLEKFIQKLKEKQINTKLYNSNNQAIERIEQKSEKTIVLTKEIKNNVDKRLAELDKKENK